MSSASLSQIKQFARNEIKNIFPLDDESIDEMISYTLGNFKSREAMSNHFLDILGPSDLTFQFISRFTDMIFDPKESEKHLETKSTASSSPSPKSETKKVTNKPKTAGIRLVKTKPVIPADMNKGRLSSNSKNGTTTSEMFDLKPKTVEMQRLKNKEVKKRLESINDLDEVLMQLELNDNNISNDIRICNCNATKHPLFEMYPNCLNCGKIICEREGLQPCSFCGISLISEYDRQQMMEVINQRKEELEDNAKAVSAKPSTPKSRKKNVMKITLNTPGQNNFKVQEQFYQKLAETEKQRQELEEQKKEEQKLVEQTKKDLDFYKSVHKKDEELIKAEERLAMLLNFQDNGTERTKIIDNASDFDLPTNAGSLWASPIERVLQFKRQQKQRSKMENADLRRSGRGETVLNVEIKDGEIHYTEKPNDLTLDDNLSDDEEIKKLQKQANEEKIAQFNKEVETVYDFDNFNRTLFKPIYKNTETTAVLITPADDLITNLPELGTIVQLGDAETQEEQLINMIGV